MSHSRSSHLSLNTFSSVLSISPKLVISVGKWISDAIPSVIISITRNWLLHLFTTPGEYWQSSSNNFWRRTTLEESCNASQFVLIDRQTHRRDNIFWIPALKTVLYDQNKTLREFGDNDRSVKIGGLKKEYLVWNQISVKATGFGRRNSNHVYTSFEFG